MGVRILVCGGRDFDDWDQLVEVLDRVHAERGVDQVIHGDAAGADRMGGRWAIYRGIHEFPVRANWEGEGRAAGPLRNARMLELKPDAVIAFPGGRGTADMMAKARVAGVPVWEPLRGRSYRRAKPADVAPR